MMPRITLDGLECMETDLEAARCNFLRQRGWKYTCETPGCYWMWERMLPDGRTILVDTQTAISMDSALSQEDESES